MTIRHFPYSFHVFPLRSDTYMKMVAFWFILSLFSVRRNDKFNASAAAYHIIQFVLVFFSFLFIFCVYLFYSLPSLRIRMENLHPIDLLDGFLSQFFLFHLLVRLFYSFVDMFCLFRMATTTSYLKASFCFPTPPLRLYTSLSLKSGFVIEPDRLGFI